MIGRIILTAIRMLTRTHIQLNIHPMVTILSEVLDQLVVIN